MIQRCVPLLGTIALEKLKNSHICVFGVGGVGGFVLEGLARLGVTTFTIVDNDIVNTSNKNRQIIALESTIGKKKVDVMKARILDINPNAIVNCIDLFITEDNIDDISFDNFTYVVDCIDNVKGKLAIIKKAKDNNIAIISSMGTGNKLNPMLFQIKDISKTTVCPLAKTIRLNLRKMGIKDVKVLFSTEEPIKSEEFISSVSFVPSVAGLLIAREVALDISNSCIEKY